MSAVVPGADGSVVREAGHCHYPADTLVKEKSIHQISSHRRVNDSDKALKDVRIQKEKGRGH